LLLLLSALGWHFRSPTVAVMPLALAAPAKLFVWPLLVWLLVTRRYRAFAASLATIGLTVALWAVVDPGGMRRYPQTVRLLNEVQRWKSYSVQSLLISLHAPALTSELVAGAVAFAAAPHRRAGRVSSFGPRRPAAADIASGRGDGRRHEAAPQRPLEEGAYSRPGILGDRRAAVGSGLFVTGRQVRA